MCSFSVVNMDGRVGHRSHACRWCVTWCMYRCDPRLIRWPLENAGDTSVVRPLLGFLFPKAQHPTGTTNASLNDGAYGSYCRLLNHTYPFWCAIFIRPLLKSCGKQAFSFAALSLIADKHRFLLPRLLKCVVVNHVASKSFDTVVHP